MTVPARPLVLVIDDRDDITAFCRRLLGETHDFEHARSWHEAALVLGARDVAAVLLDRDFSQTPASERIGPAGDARNEGLHVLRRLREDHADLPVIMVTGQRETSVALQAARLGADFVAWDDVGEEPDLLAARLQHAIASGSLEEASHAGEFRKHGVVGESPKFLHALKTLWRALPGQAPILLLGESGAGKGVLAHAAHALSGPAGRPFQHLDLSRTTSNFVEAELFGHEKGAFTDAHVSRIGRLRAAHGGTLFLDEIGNLTLEIQAKLLIALESRSVVPLGATRPEPAEFRLVTATSGDLHERMNAGLFRPDLYHRIAVHVVVVPPLRDRVEDIPALADAFLRRTPQRESGAVTGIARETHEHLASMSWPGNVRELGAVIAAAAAEGVHQVTVRDVLEAMLRREAPARDAPAGSNPEDAVFGPHDYRELTRQYFHWLCVTCGNRMADVALRAGISKATAYEWKAKFGLPGDGDPAGDARDAEPTP